MWKEIVYIIPEGVFTIEQVYLFHEMVIVYKRNIQFQRVIVNNILLSLKSGR